MNTGRAVLGLLTTTILFAAGCGDGTSDGTTSPAKPTESATKTTAMDLTHSRVAFREGLARSLAAAPSSLAAELQQERRGLVLADVAARVPALQATVAAAMARATAELRSDDVPEVWLYEPRSHGASPASVAASTSDVLVAYVPAGNDRTWTTVTAFAADGSEVQLDAHVPPSVPVLVVETHGRRAMERGIQEANTALLRAGLQPTKPLTSPLRAAEAGTWTVKLDSIHLEDDQEPWISGDAEVYAVTSGVVDDNQPVVKLVDLPYLSSDAVTYNPGQIVLDWQSYAYQAANIQLFEHDDNTNYKDLVTALIAAVAAGGTLAGQPEVAAIAEIAGRIVQAMPSSWFSNDDDYLDSFYTIEKGVAYSERWGAAGNARVTLSPFFLRKND